MGARDTTAAERIDPMTHRDPTALTESPPAGLESAPAGKTSDAGEYLTAAAIIGIGVLFWVGAADYSDATRRWPVFLCYVVVGLGVVNLLALVYRRAIAGRPVLQGSSTGGSSATTTEDAASEPALASDTPAGRQTTRTGYRRQVLTGLFCIAYAVLGYGAGFLVATALLLPTYILLSFRPRRPLLAVLVTAALLVFMHVIFTGALNAPLNQGVWVGVDLSWLPF